MLHRVIHAVAVGSSRIVPVSTHLLHALHGPIEAFIGCSLQHSTNGRYDVLPHPVHPQLHHTSDNTAALSSLASMDVKSEPLAG